MIRRFDVFDEVEKVVVPFGNGSIVYTPKKWIGCTVRVILETEPLNVNELVMEPLKPFLEHVRGVFLHGSFARNEQSKDSDIDVLVIADKKFKLEKTGRLDFVVMDENTLRKELNGIDPFFAYFMLHDSKPILNSELLEELKKIKIDKFNFKWLLDESESALKIVKAFLEQDKLEERKNLDSIAVIYTMVLRLRRFFLVQCLLEKKQNSNKEFKSFLEKKGLTGELVEKFYEIYRTERDDKKTERIVSMAEAEKLYELTQIELEKMKEEYKWHQKRSS